MTTNLYHLASMSDYLDLFKEHLNAQRTISSVENELIIDGNNLFIRSFCADPKINANGIPVGGVYGFVKALSTLAKSYNPRKIFVVFDGKNSKNLRSKILSEYKAHRGTVFRFNRPEGFAEHIDEEESFRYQLIQLGNVLDTLPVMTIAPDGIEGDDVISFIAQQRLKSNPNSHIIIASADKDLLQLVSERCWVYSPVKQIMYTITEIQREFGIHYANFILVKILSGDISDGISGVSGVGIKTMIKRFPNITHSPLTIDEILDECNEKCLEKRPLKIYKMIIDSLDIIKRNENLMILDGRLLPDSVVIKLHQFLQHPPDMGSYITFANTFGRIVTSVSPLQLADIYRNIIHNISWKV